MGDPSDDSSGAGTFWSRIHSSITLISVSLLRVKRRVSPGRVWEARGNTLGHASSVINGVRYYRGCSRGGLSPVAALSNASRL